MRSWGEGLSGTIGFCSHTERTVTGGGASSFVVGFGSSVDIRDYRGKRYHADGK